MQWVWFAKKIIFQLYSLAYNPEVLLTDIFTDSGWNFKFRRNLFDRKMQEVVFIHLEMQSAVVLLEKEDGLLWKASIIGSFIVSSYYKKTQCYSSSAITKFPWTYD